MHFYIAYSFIKNWEKDWNQIDSADKLVKNKDVSFAFMNLSKYGNNTGLWKLDKNKFEKFIKDTKKSAEKNLFIEEIRILEPQYIVTLNLNKQLTNCFGDSIKLIDDKNKNCFLYDLTVGSKHIFLFDTWHFSSRKSREKNIFLPIKECYEKSKNMDL